MYRALYRGCLKQHVTSPALSMSLIGITFIISCGVFVSIMGMAYMEAVRGVRYGGNWRRALDRRLSKMARGTHDMLFATVDFFKRDVFARTLHILSYLALTFVQYTEQRLVRVTVFFRSFRKHRHQQPTKSFSIEREKEFQADKV